MSIHETLISLLIIGMFSVDFAQPRVLAEDQMTAQSPGDFAVKWLKNECIAKLNSLELTDLSPFSKRVCNESVVSMNKFVMDVKLAKLSGNFDVPIKNFCEKIPIVEQCMSDLVDFFSQCLEPEEKEAFKIDHNIIVSGMQFACHDGGDRLIRYLADGAVECIVRKRAELQVCLDENVAGFFSTTSEGIFDLTNHPLMNQRPEMCSNLEEFKTCTVTVLETCPDPTTVNAVDGLFKAAIRATPCEELDNYTPQSTPTEVTAIGGRKQGTGESGVTVEGLMKQNLVKQIEASEAQVRAANAQEKAARAQEHAVRVLEHVAEHWLTINAF